MKKNTAFFIAVLSFLAGLGTALAAFMAFFAYKCRATELDCSCCDDEEDLDESEADEENDGCDCGCSDAKESAEEAYG